MSAAGAVGGLMGLDGGVTYRALAVLVTRSSAGIKGSTEPTLTTVGRI